MKYEEMSTSNVGDDNSLLVVNAESEVSNSNRGSVVGSGNGGSAVVVSAGGGSSGHGKCGHMSLTPRFTQDEKEILYGLFHQHEEIIDIKFRKKQKSKYSVRDAWEQIVQEFNSHPGISAMRNLKQIQKFWLNARLRKQYPFRNIGQKHANNHHHSAEEDTKNIIKDEPEFNIGNNETSEHHSHSNEFEEMELDATAVTTLDNSMEHEQESHQHHQQQQQQQQQTVASMQQINVDQISTEKLSLNDLLHFKTSRPREEIILQIKHSTDASAAQITIPMQQANPPQHTMATITASGYNQQIISEIKPQQTTLSQYQGQQQSHQQLVAQQQQQQQQHQQQHHHQQQIATQQQHQHQQLIAQQQTQQHQQVKLQLQSPAATQFVTGATPTFTCSTFSNLSNIITPTTTMSTALATTSVGGCGNNSNNNNNHNNTTTTTNTVSLESFEEKINYFKLKEAEIRLKEEQVTLEKKKIELNRAQDELKHMREMHRLQIEEVKMRIRLLQEEEKQLRKNQTATT